jgi:hypothetical protein
VHVDLDAVPDSDRSRPVDEWFWGSAPAGKEREARQRFVAGVLRGEGVGDAGEVGVGDEPMVDEAREELGTARFIATFTRLAEAVAHGRVEGDIIAVTHGT